MRKRPVPALMAIGMILALTACQGNTIRVSWKEQLTGAVPADVKAIQVLDFKSEVKHETGTYTSGSAADQSYGKTLATTLAERIQQAGRFKVLPADADMKKFLDSRDVMDALVNEGVMKPEVKEKLQKVPGLDAILVGEVSCSTRKDEHQLSLRGYNLPLKTINATVTVNFRMLSVKTGTTILPRTITKSKGGIGAQAVDQALMPLITQAVDEFSRDLLGGEVVRNGKMFVGEKEDELRGILQPLEAGVSPDRITDKLEAYAKAHPDSAAALYNLGVLAFMKGNREGAQKLIEDAMMKPGADAREFKRAYDEMAGGSR